MLFFKHHFKSTYENLDSQLYRLLSQNPTSSVTGGLLYVWVKGVPLIITSHGSKMAKSLIKDLQNHLKQFLSPDDFVLHINKDHFAIIFPCCTPEQMEVKALEVFNFIVNYQYPLAPSPIQLSTTIGGAHFLLSSRNKDKIEDIINNAYVALNDAKDSYRHYMLFTDQQTHADQSTEQMTLANSLQKALVNNKLCLAFQPIIDRITLQPVFYECLLRIMNEDGSVSSVGPAIPAVEKMGFIDLIDSVALRLTIDELRANPDICLSVNVSSITLQQPHWLVMALSLLQESKIASRLILEVTETFEYHQLTPLTNALEKLKSLGCAIALDDFGAGYTSLSHIRMLPIDIIKIDGSFVRHMLNRPDHYAFVQTLIELGQRLHIKTIAEFVENIPIAKAASSLQVDYMQGHYFATATCERPWLGKGQHSVHSSK